MTFTSLWTIQSVDVVLRRRTSHCDDAFQIFWEAVWDLKVEEGSAAHVWVGLIYAHSLVNGPIVDKQDYLSREMSLFQYEVILEEQQMLSSDGIWFCCRWKHTNTHSPTPRRRGGLWLDCHLFPGRPFTFDLSNPSRGALVWCAWR